MADRDAWVASVEAKIEAFAARYSTTYSKAEREVSASFEIGCFHALCEFYSRRCDDVLPKNLTLDDEYRYLTTPNGNPANFSYIELVHQETSFELRQQVRIRSCANRDIAFTPDLLVVRSASEIRKERDKDYAGGKRAFFCLDSSDVVAAHECKSMNPFPELLVSFLGILLSGHEWLDATNWKRHVSEDGFHLAPSLFIGGSPRSLHLRMVAALEQCYPINVILGLHAGTWSLLGEDRKLNLLPEMILGRGGVHKEPPFLALEV